MQNNNKSFVYFIALFLVSVVSSCEIEDRFIELPEHDSRLVLDAQLYQSDTISNIILTESIGITDTFYTEENIDLRNSSQLTLHTPDQGAIEAYVYQEPSQFSSIQSALWKFDYEDFIAGETYTIEAEAEGYDKITAETTIPMEAELIEVIVDLKESTDPTRFFVRDRFEITINDPAEEDNYYFIHASREIDDQGFKSIRTYRFYDSPQNPIDESFLENTITVLDDSNFNGTEHTFVVYGERGPQPFEEIEFKIYQITEEAYNYQVAFTRSNTDSPFSEPVTFPNNINNGFGIFSVTSKPTTKIIEI